MAHDPWTWSQKDRYACLQVPEHHWGSSPLSQDALNSLLSGSNCLESLSNTESSCQTHARRLELIHWTSQVESYKNSNQAIGSTILGSCLP